MDRICEILKAADLDSKINVYGLFGDEGDYTVVYRKPGSNDWDLNIAFDAIKLHGKNSILYVASKSDDDKLCFRLKKSA